MPTLSEVSPFDPSNTDLNSIIELVMQISIYYFRANERFKDAVKMWVYCPDGVYRLDCVLENGVPSGRAELRVRGSKYRLSIEGIGSFREPKTLKEVNVILARHGLWPFRETSERCPEHFKCLAKIDPERNIITV